MTPDTRSYDSQEGAAGCHGATTVVVGLNLGRSCWCFTVCIAVSLARGKESVLAAPPKVADMDDLADPSCVAHNGETKYNSLHFQSSTQGRGGKENGGAADRCEQRWPADVASSSLF